MAKSYRIILRSKHTGEETHLGSTYQSIEEAQKYIDSDVCEQSNSVSIKPVYEGTVWQDRHIGFTRREDNAGRK